MTLHTGPVTAAGPSSRSSPASSGAGERILEAANELFSRRRIRDVGISELIERDGVAKATFYHHYHSKDEVIRPFLARRDELWTMNQIVAGAGQQHRHSGSYRLRSRPLPG